jgi:hypothetical protein
MQTLGRPRTIRSICTGLVAAPASEKIRSTFAQQEILSLPLASFPGDGERQCNLTRRATRVIESGHMTGHLR